MFDYPVVKRIEFNRKESVQVSDLSGVGYRWRY